MNFYTTRHLNLLSCHSCHLLIERGDGRAKHQRCPRCGSHIHQRKPASVSRTWAFLIAATIFYVPANILPMTITTALGVPQADTILSGVIYFMQSGSWEIAAVIFTASIFVPLAKLLILSFLLLSIQFHSKWRPKDRTTLFRITEFAGRWSMVDIYVVTILVALVKLGKFASIEAGPAAKYFAAVVILTMLAAESFDPRLIWDAAEE